MEYAVLGLVRTHTFGVGDDDSNVTTPAHQQATSARPRSASWLFQPRTGLANAVLTRMPNEVQHYAARASEQRDQDEPARY